MKKAFKSITLSAVYFLVPTGFDISIYQDPRIIIVTAITIIMVMCQPDMKIKEEVKQRKFDKLSFYLILICASLGQIINTIDWYYSDRIISEKGILAFSFGISFVVFGMILRISSIKKLGRFFCTTIQINKGHKLIKCGPYSIVRHPSYLGAYCAFLGSSLIMGSINGLLFNSCFILISYLYRIKVEEEMLSSYFGSEFSLYQQRTKKFMPLLF